jgi:hypothetical protein
MQVLFSFIVFKIQHFADNAGLNVLLKFLATRILREKSIYDFGMRLRMIFGSNDKKVLSDIYEAVWF